MADVRAGTSASSFGLVDVHTHVLPGLDDGAAHTSDAVEMLRLAYQQGVRHMWATPHFYPHRERPEDFLRRREVSIRKLGRAWDGTCMPRVYAAAEVAYFFGIGRTACARHLCLEETPYILVEMPGDVWTPEILDDLLMLRFAQGLKPILVHVERCVFLQKKSVIRRLGEEGVLFQCNSRYMTNYEEHKKEIKFLLRNDCFDLLGSDCHNTQNRKPNMESGLRVLREVMEREQLQTVLRRAADITRKSIPCC